MSAMLDEKVLSVLKRNIETLQEVRDWVFMHEPCGYYCDEQAGHVDHKNTNWLNGVIGDFEQLVEHLEDSSVGELTYNTELGYLELIEPQPPQRGRVICASGWLGKTGELVVRTEAGMYGLMFEGQAEPVFFSRNELEFL